MLSRGSVHDKPSEHDWKIVGKYDADCRSARLIDERETIQSRSALHESERSKGTAEYNMKQFLIWRKRLVDDKDDRCKCCCEAQSVVWNENGTPGNFVYVQSTVRRETENKRKRSVQCIIQVCEVLLIKDQSATRPLIRITESYWFSWTIGEAWDVIIAYRRQRSRPNTVYIGKCKLSGT